MWRGAGAPPAEAGGGGLSRGGGARRLGWGGGGRGVGGGAGGVGGVVGAALDEAGERVLLECGQPVTRPRAARREPLAPGGRRDQPPEPQRRRERLRDRADVEHE